MRYLRAWLLKLASLAVGLSVTKCFPWIGHVGGSPTHDQDRPGHPVELSNYEKSTLIRRCSIDHVGRLCMTKHKGQLYPSDNSYGWELNHRKLSAATAYRQVIIPSRRFDPSHLAKWPCNDVRQICPASIRTSPRVGKSGCRQLRLGGGVFSARITDMNIGLGIHLSS
ncbi:hypothetical protein RRG08_052060 [Elysia crispata]|uniref:Secreted protein n=1 Tax=Elysia crispata TaxID=231223 RepID=A0AAE1A4P3_9GAST|nr:hypothetical protein RRG08_052060 [Elysia crispata]